MTTYRTTDLAKWGAGIGMRLSATQVDVNFWDINVRLDALEALPAPTAGIDDFTISGRNLYLTLTDATILGPQTLPIATYRSRGAWAPETNYSALDTVTINGGLVEVLIPHTSGLTFDIAANDGMGHDYYSQMLDDPGNALPSGGAEGQILIKSASTSYAVTWAWRYPGSGLAGMVPIQQSSTQDDVEFGYVQAENVEFTPSSDSSLTSDNVADAIEEAANAVGDAADMPYSPSSDSGLTSETVADALDELGVAVAAGGGGGAVEDLTNLVMHSDDPSSGALIYYDGNLDEWTLSNLISPNRCGQQMFWDPFTFSWRPTNNNTLATSGTVNIEPRDGPVFTIRPSGAVTLGVNAVNSANMEITLIVLSDGTSSYNITFDSGSFKSTGVLATGTVDQKHFVMKFIKDPITGFWLEISRTVAM